MLLTALRRWRWTDQEEKKVSSTSLRLSFSSHFLASTMRLPARIRLQRIGNANRPLYEILVSPTRKPRRIETLGQWDPIPRETPIKQKSLLDGFEWRLEKRLEWNKQRVEHWLKVGAKPSPAVMALLRRVRVRVSP
jgi:small subunit ribosomal protein S16